MAVTLPPSLRKDLHTTDEEVAWARTLTPSERLEALGALCRDAVLLPGMNANAERILELRDPLPASTVEALRRLKRRP